MSQMDRVRNSHRARKSARPWGRAWIWALIIALVFQPFPALADGMEGDGSPGDPYIIKTLDDLNAIRDIRDGLDKHYKLGANITVSGDWTPIGTKSAPFTGHFDGDGHSISGFSLTVGFWNETEYVGLFGYTQGAEIKNVTLQNPSVSYEWFSDAKVGIVLGGGTNTKISNVHVIGGSVAGYQVVGGLVGEIGAGSEIRESSSGAEVTVNGVMETATGGLVGSMNQADVYDSSASGDVKAGLTDNAGGLIGKAQNSNISGSQASGKVSGYERVGGLIGDSSDTTITNSSASGAVTGQYDTGGLIGRSVNNSVSGSHASGNVNGQSRVGGLIGYSEFSLIQSGSASGNVNGSDTIGGLLGHSVSSTISDSEASGNVTGQTSKIGGLIGFAESSDISNVHAHGDVTGLLSSEVGGLIGMMSGYSLMLAYATGNVDGHTNVGGLIGLLSYGAVMQSYASGESIVGSFETGGLIGQMEDGDIVFTYAQGAIDQYQVYENAGGLIGRMKSGMVSISYAAVSLPQYADNTGGLIGLKEDGLVEFSYYDSSKSGHSDTGKGEPKSTYEMTLYDTYEDWDFDEIWQMDQRAGYPQLVGLETLKPAIKAAIVRDDSPDVLEIAFYEQVAIDQEALDHLQVMVDDKSVSFTGAPGEKQWLLLTLESGVAPLQTVKLIYDSAHPIVDRSGNTMDSVTFTAENLVASSLELESFTPVNGAKNVPAATNLTLTFNNPVTPVAGKTITIHKLFSGKTVETISVTDASKVTVSGATVTVNPATDLSDSTVYYVQVDGGAFKDAGDNLSMGIAGSNAWKFETGKDAEKQWIDAGKSGLTDADSESASLFADGDTLYVAYPDKAHDGKLTVMKLDLENSDAWQPVGEAGFTRGKADQPSLYVDNGTPYVAFADDSAGSKVTVMTYDDGSDEWIEVGGTGITGHAAVSLSLAVDNETPYLAYEYKIGSSDYYIDVMTHDVQTGWKKLGTITEDSAGSPSIRIHQGIPYVAFQDYLFQYGFGATVMYYDSGTNAWIPAGERGFTPDFAFETNLFISNDKLFVAYKNDAYKAEAMMFDEDEEEWTLIGTPGFSADQVYGTALFVEDGEPYVAYRDEGKGKKITVMKYTGEEWVQVGDSASAGAADNPSLVVVDGVPYVAFVGGDGALSVKKYDKPAPVVEPGDPDDNPGGGSGNPGGGRGGNSGGNQGDDESSDENQDGGIIVIVDGKELGQIADSTETEEAGRKNVTVTVDTERLIDQLEASGDTPDVKIPVTQQTDQISAVLTGQAVKAMETKQAVLVIETAIGNYVLPAAEFLIDQAAAQFGEEVSLQDIIVTVEVAKGSEDTERQLREIADEDGFAIVVPPVEFTVKVSHGDTELEINRFTTFIQREIPLPADTDPSAITTAVVMDPDGTIRHVPTYITVRDGVYYAIVNSLTNSAYTLVYYEAKFNDMEGHWANPAVTDLASRKIVSGVGEGRFNPNASVKRSEFAAFLVRALGLPVRKGEATFGDVKPTDWFAGSVSAAAEYGLASGYEDGSYRPSETIKREAAMAMIARAMELAGLKPVDRDDVAEEILSRFSDGASVSPWAKRAVATVVSYEVSVGSGSWLRPKEEITRAETVSLLQRMLREANLID